MSSERTGFETYSTYKELLEHIEGLLTDLSRFAIPEREFERFSCSTNFTYSDLPDSIRDYVDLSNLTVAIDFIRELDDGESTKNDTPIFIDRLAVELISKDRLGPRSIFIREDENGFGLSLIKNGIPIEDLGTIRAEDIARLLLPLMGVDQSALQGLDLSGTNLFVPEKFDKLHELIELHGQRDYLTKQYQINSLGNVNITEEGSDTGDTLPTEIRIAIRSGDFKITVSIKTGFELIIEQEGIEIHRPESDLLNELYTAMGEMRQKVTGQTQPEILMNPSEIETLIPNEESL